LDGAAVRIGRVRLLQFARGRLCAKRVASAGRDGPSSKQSALFVFAFGERFERRLPLDVSLVGETQPERLARRPQDHGPLIARFADPRGK